MTKKGETILPHATIAQAKGILGVARKTGITVNIIGVQGIGKSKLVQQYAEENNYDYVEVRLGQMEVGDLVGIPTVAKDKNGEPITIWGRPCWWPQPNKNGTVLFFDEWNRAQATDIIQAVFQVFLDKKLHTHILPDNCQVIIAMNPPTRGFMVNKFDDVALMDRMLHVNLQPTAKEWISWAKDNNVNTDLIDYVRTAADAILGSTVCKAVDRKASRRSWEMVSKFQAAASSGEWADLGYLILSGLVGTDQAVAFTTFMTDREYKPLQATEVLNEFSKHSAKVKKWVKDTDLRMDVLNGTCENLVDFFSKITDDKGVKATWRDNYIKFAKLLPADLIKSHIKTGIVKAPVLVPIIGHALTNGDFDDIKKHIMESKA